MNCFKKEHSRKQTLILKKSILQQNNKKKLCIQHINLGAL